MLIWDRENQIRLLRERIKKLTADNARLQQSYDAMAKDLERMVRARDEWKEAALKAERCLRSRNDWMDEMYE